MHFPAILCNYNAMTGGTACICRRFILTTAFLVSILLKENHKIADFPGDFFTASTLRILAFLIFSEFYLKNSPRYELLKIGVVRATS